VKSFVRSKERFDDIILRTKLRILQVVIIIRCRYESQDRNGKERNLLLINNCSTIAILHQSRKKPSCDDNRLCLVRRRPLSIRDITLTLQVQKIPFYTTKVVQGHSNHQNSETDSKIAWTTEQVVKSRSTNLQGEVQ